MSEVKNEKGQPKALTTRQVVEVAQRNLAAVAAKISDTAEYQELFKALLDLYHRTGDKVTGAAPAKAAGKAADAQTPVPPAATADKAATTQAAQ